MYSYHLSVWCTIASSSYALPHLVPSPRLSPLVTTSLLSMAQSLFLFFLINLFILIGGQLLCNTVMVFAMHQYESAIVIHVPPPSWTPLPPTSPAYPSRLSQRTSFGCHVSYVKLSLVIYFTYGDAYISVLFSQIVPPCPSPTESKILFFTSASPLLPYT